MKTITSQKNLILQLVLAAILLLSVSLSARASRQQRSTGNFHKVEISGAFEVYLDQGKTESLFVEASDDILPKIITEVKGQVLVIRLKSHLTIPDHESMKVYLTFKELESIEISGAVKLTGTMPLKFNDLELECSGASKLDLNLNAANLDCNFSGAAIANLAGECSSLDVETSGASKLHAADLRTHNCTLDCSGASQAGIYVTGKLQVTGSGAANIEYAGNPETIEKDMSGACSIHKR